jgi:hypothetical protein
MTTAEQPSPHQEVQELAIEFGLQGYKVGEVIRQEGSDMVVSEIDYFADESTQPEVIKRPKSQIPHWYLMRQGARYCIKSYFEDIEVGGKGTGTQYSSWRDWHTETTVFIEDSHESDALHAIIIPGL